MQHLFTLFAARGKVCLEVSPHGPVLLRCVGESTNSASAMHRIKRRKIYELHRKAARSPSHLRSYFHNDGVALVHFPKRQLAVEIQRDERVFVRPFHRRSFYHTVRLPNRPGIAK